MFKVTAKYKFTGKTRNNTICMHADIFCVFKSRCISFATNCLRKLKRVQSALINTLNTHKKKQQISIYIMAFLHAALFIKSQFGLCINVDLDTFREESNIIFAEENNLNLFEIQKQLFNVCYFLNNISDIFRLPCFANFLRCN